MLIDINFLALTKDLQAQHGLKYENYDRYRSYCTRHLHRLRRSLNVHQGVQSSAKARHQRARKLLYVTNEMVLEAGEKNQEYAERMLTIPLFLAERAWAYAMHLKHGGSERYALQNEEENVERHPRGRFHMVRRLKKASEHAQRFEKLCHDPESPCSEQTKQEATAYAAYIDGLYQVERNNWKEAEQNLNKALKLYFKLSVAIRKEDILEQYRQRIDELRASLRYCLFNLADQESKKKKPTVQLPSVLQFHDIAFKHAQRQFELAQKLEEEAKQEEALAKAADADAEEGEADVFDEARDEAAEQAEEEVEEEDEEEEEDSDDDDEPEQQGGVTGLVKGWLGGAWSRK